MSIIDVCSCFVLVFFLMGGEGFVIIVLFLDVLSYVLKLGEVWCYCYVCFCVFNVINDVVFVIV